MLSLLPRFATFPEVLRTRARENPNGLAYVFLEDGEAEGARLTFGELDEWARAIAAALAARGAAGERALLLFPPGLDFIAAFFGCLYAGAVAVPSYPPGPPRAGRGQPRLRAIAEDASPRFVLTTSALLPRLEALAGELPALARAARLATDALPAGAGRGMAAAGAERGVARLPAVHLGLDRRPQGGDGRATATCSHNQEVIRQAFAHDERATFVSWLPLYHDMGLIGGVLQPLYVGASCALMSPLAFLQRPSRWLRAIARYRATHQRRPELRLRPLRATRSRPSSAPGST